MRKAIALFLCLCLCLSLVPAAFAEDGERIEESKAPEESVLPEETILDETEELPEVPLGELGGEALEASSGTCGENLTWTKDDAGNLTISGSGEMTDFSGTAPWGTDIVTLTIESGVTSIGKYAFDGCAGLTSVTIPEGVTAIGYRAFYGCGNLTEVTLPETVTSIGSSAFYECASLKSVTIPQSVTSLGNYVFYGCGSLTDVTIPEGLTSLGSYLFCGCSGLTEVSIPETVTSIGNGAFYDCAGLTGLTIPESVKSIGSVAFCGCSGLTEVSIPSGVTSLGFGTFSGCSELTSVSIPSGVKSIGEYSFCGCSSLADVTIPSGVTSIGEDAFYGCSSLTSVSIPSGVRSIGKYTFYGCSSLTAVSIPSRLTSIGEYAFCGCGSLTGVTLPSRLTSIGEYAFCGCGSLTSVTIPSRVTSIGDFAFYDCGNLKSISVSGDNSAYCAVDGVLLTKNKRLLICCPGGKSGAYDIPEGVTSIADCAFHNCGGLTGVTIPEGVASIGSNAFFGCSGLTDMALPESVTSIGEYAFYGCGGLEAISVSEDNPAYCAVDGVLFSKDGSLLICCPGGKSGEYVIPASVSSIEEGAFYGCGSLTGVTIPADVTSIGRGAFFGCTALRDVCYYGSEDAWTALTIGSFNDPLLTAALHFIIPEPSAAYSYSLSLADSIDINFTVKDLAAGTRPADYRIVYSFCGETVEEPLTGMMSNSFVIANTAAKEMTEEATVEVWYKDTLLKTGTYSVRGYCEAMLDTEPDARLTALLQSCLDYGSYAQKYFDYKAEDLANRGTDYGDVPGVVIPEAANVKEGSCTGIVSPSYSLMLQSKTTFEIALNHVPEAQLADYSFTVNGAEVEPADTGSKFVIDLNGIAAKNLGDKVVVTVTHKDGTSYRFESAPVNYMYAARNTAVSNTMKALYAYHQAAVNYFA